MNQYTPKNPPKRGTAKMIWDGLHKAELDVIELHYNGNAWGNRYGGTSWGRWACSIRRDGRREEWFTGLNDANQVYLVGIHAGARPFVPTPKP